jgi:hypothetical protein
VFQDQVMKAGQPGEFCDVLTEVLRQGADPCSPRPSKPRSRVFSNRIPAN